MFYVLQFVNTAKKPVDVGGAARLRSAGRRGRRGNDARVGAERRRRRQPRDRDRPFKPGNTLIQFAYSMPLGSEEIVLAQKMPVQVTQLSVVAQKIGTMQLASPQLTQQREMNADGQTYIVGQGGAVKAGDTVTLTLSDLPHRPTWPRNVALLADVPGARRRRVGRDTRRPRRSRPAGSSSCTRAATSCSPSSPRSKNSGARAPWTRGSMPPAASSS